MKVITVTVTTAGTAVAVASSRTLASWVKFQGKQDNDGSCFIGGSTVTNSSGAAPGHELFPAGIYEWPTFGAYYDLGDAYIDADNNGDIVTVTYDTR